MCVCVHHLNSYITIPVKYTRDNSPHWLFASDDVCSIRQAQCHLIFSFYKMIICRITSKWCHYILHAFLLCILHIWKLAFINCWMAEHNETTNNITILILLFNILLLFTVWEQFQSTRTICLLSFCWTQKDAWVIAQSLRRLRKQRRYRCKCLIASCILKFRLFFFYW